MSEQKGLSRRKFLVGAGLAAGTLAAAGTGIVLPKSAEAAYTALPWAYATLDVNLVRRRAYDAFYVGECMYAAAKGLITTLIERVGAPWDSIPIDMFKYGGGGVYNWGTTCGNLNGACWVIQACAGANASKVIDNLFQWYCTMPFPSTAMDSYAVFKRQRTSVSDSPLCHASSSNWTYQNRPKTISSPERKDRCAKLGGDVAAKTAELLNALAAGTFSYTFTQPNANCSGCHVGAASTYDQVQMKSTCTHYCHIPGKKGGDMPIH